MLCQTEQFHVYQCHRLPFAYTSHQFVFIPVIYSFIEYTSAPVEVSVWLGSITLKSVFVAFYVQDAVKAEGGLWEPHVPAGVLHDAGQQVRAERQLQR